MGAQRIFSRLKSLLDVALGTPAKGDLIVYDSVTGKYSKRAVGANNTVLTADSAENDGVKWGAAGSGSSPTTTRGDLIRRGAAADERLALGSQWGRLTSDGTDVVWENLSRNYGWEFFDDCITDVAGVSPVFSAANASNGAVQNRGAIDANHPGMASFETGAVSASSYASVFTSRIQLFFGGGAVSFETTTYVLTALSDGTESYDFFIGFGDNRSLSGQTDGIYFLYDHNTSANWQCVTAKASTRTTVGSGVPVALAAWQKLRIEVNAAGTSAAFYIADTLVATIGTNIPNTASNTCGLLASIVKSAGTSDRRVYVDYFYARQTFTTPR